MHMQAVLKDRYFLVILLSAAIFTVYWTAYGIYRYNNFLDNYYDIGALMSSLYVHIHCLNFAPDFQYLVVSNHIAPLMLLLVPAFALYQSPATLFFIQSAFLALTALAIYLIANSLIKSSKISFALSFAFLINPGVRGLTMFDVHTEAFIPLFYILAFYFFWKGNRRYFGLSYILLLCTVDIAFFIGLTLLVGLFLFELLYDRKGKDRFHNRVKMIIAGIAITAVFALFYYSLGAYLTSHYNTAPYSSVPRIYTYINFISYQLHALNSPNVVPINGNSNEVIAFYGTLGLFVIFLGFGMTSFVSPVISLALLSPWIGEVFILRNSSFPVLEYQYYGTIIGASFVASLMGILILKERKSLLSKFIKYDDRLESILFASILSLIFAISAVTFPFAIIGSTLGLSGAPALNYTQVNNAIAMIPHNMSVLAQQDIAPHLFYECNLQVPPSAQSQFFNKINLTISNPDYVIVDKQLHGYAGVVDSNPSVPDYVRSNYSVFYNQSGITIYKRSD